MTITLEELGSVRKPEGPKPSVASVVVQVTEVEQISPDEENGDQKVQAAHGPDQRDYEAVEVVPELVLSEDPPTMATLERTATTDISRPAKTPDCLRALHRSSSFGFLSSHSMAPDVRSKRRGPGMLPSFRSLGISSSDPSYLDPNIQHTIRQTPGSLHTVTGRVTAQSLPTRPHTLNPPAGSTALLTPPEDADSIKWNNALMHHSPPYFTRSSYPTSAGQQLSISNEAEHHGGLTNVTTGQQPHSTTSTGQSTETIPEAGRMSNAEPALETATHYTVSPLGGVQLHNVQVVSQVLPLPQSDLSTTRPAVQKIVEKVQNQFAHARAPFITITHAVPQKFDMSDLPSSPPVTPSIHHAGDDYFGQSIFASAAIVPTYHSSQGVPINSGMPSPRVIVAPSSVQVAVLERCIPPVSFQEYKDFLSSTGPSMLVDRLAELSPTNGTLLLVYPTKAGAKTFASSYLAPIFDPYLRHFLSVNNLYLWLGLTLGSMAAVEQMDDFPVLESKVKRLCQSIGHMMQQRSGSPSRYSVVYSGTEGKVVDRATWMDWFVEQETPRLRQDLISYQTNGGRMPQEVGHTQITPGVLARHIVDGLRHSSEPSGGVPIELGVFVIKRTTR